MFRRWFVKNAVILLCFFAFTAIVEGGPDRLTGISFINGTWSGKWVDKSEEGCLTVNFKAVSDTAFSGNGIGYEGGCGSNPAGLGTFTGNITGFNVTGSVSTERHGENATCNINGKVDPTFSTMSWGLDCTGAGDPSWQMTWIMTKTTSLNDVSESSGIANQTVQTTGMQWIDYNNDKKLDLYLVGHNGNVLFKNLGKGKFADVTAQTKTGNNGKDASGASWADIDNDGDLDVFIANASGAPTVLLNKKSVFQDISTKISSTMLANSAGGVVLRGGIWVDINNDKKSDLFVIFDGSKNQLFKQTGNLQFTNIAATARVDFSGTGRSAIAADFNDDDFQDLYVVNYGQPSKLYKNNGNETFTDVTQSAGVGFNAKSIQAAVADYDNDQLLDLFVVNSSGLPGLYKNVGNMKFKKAALTGLKKAKKGTSAAFFDIDNDMDLDLVVAQLGAKNLLFDNKGKGKFKVNTQIDLSRSDNPTGIAIGDFNNDGIPDIAIADADSDQQRGDSLYQNTGGGANNYLTVVLRGTESPRDAIGAQVVLQTGFTFQARTVTSGNGASQESLPLEFGLGPNEDVDRINIKWPSGALQELKDVSANKTLRITEP